MKPLRRLWSLSFCCNVCNACVASSVYKVHIYLHRCIYIYAHVCQDMRIHMAHIYMYIYTQQNLKHMQYLYAIIDACWCRCKRSICVYRHTCIRTYIHKCIHHIKPLRHFRPRCIGCSRWATAARAFSLASSSSASALEARTKVFKRLLRVSKFIGLGRSWLGDYTGY